MSDLTTVSPSKTSERIWDIAALLLPIVGLAPMLVLQALDKWSRYETILLPFCWLALAMIAYFERKAIAKSRWRVLLSYLFLALALSIGLASVVYFSPWAANLAMGFVFIGWAMVRFVPGTLTRILALSSLLFVTLSLPLGLEGRVISWTNALVVRLCSSVMDLFNIFHLYQPPYLAFKDHYFDVADLLGNVFSIQSMVAIVVLVSLIWRRPFLTTILNVFSALIWTLLGKILFLFTTAVFSFNGINITESFLGIFVLGVICVIFLLLLLATDAFWNAMLSPIRAGDEGVYRSATADFFNKLVIWPGKLEFAERSGRAARPAKVERSLNFQPGIAIVYGLMMAILMIPAGIAIVRNDLLLNRANYLAISYDRIPDSKSLPEDFIVKQRQRQFRIFTNSGIYGGSAKTLFWNYGGSGVDTTILLRFPVRGWMADGASSFQNMKMVESKMMNDASNWPWSESVFAGESGSSGLFFSSQLHTKGEPYEPTEDELTAASKSHTERNRLLKPVIVDMMNPKQETTKPQTFSIQMRFQSETTIGAAEKKMLTEKFLEARSILTGRLLGTTPETKPQ